MVNSLFRRLRAASSTRFYGLSLALVAGITVLLTGCNSVVTDPKDPKFIVADKGDWKITHEQLDNEIGMLSREAHETIDPARMPMYETAVLDHMVLTKLYLDKGATLQLKDVDKDEAAALDQVKERVPPGQDLETQLKTFNVTMDDLKRQIHESIITQKVLEADAFKNLDPTEDEIQKIYLEHKDDFKIPLEIRASRILIHLSDTMTPADKAAKKKLIDAAYARVKKGEAFAKVASDVSEDVSSKPQGGDMGFFHEEENEPGFDKIAFATKVGSVSPVFETALGYQFIKVTDTKPAGVASLADARGFIVTQLRPMKMAEQRKAYEKKLLADGGIVIHLPRTDLPTTPHTMPPDAAPDNGTAPAPDPAPSPASAPPAPEPTPAPAPAHTSETAPAPTPHK